ncbi:hypothetical protein [Rhizobium sp. PL01]|uniref:hypothetical protein n=1 Tax=Rhizobium sp. PL01 TaxID=3085631 RepID=UPI002980D549|nr:hypothetical protein [Rhizobium sp. PL01]MDW5317159.1 hypothetical protein [Rhizobium sp. PL01]
MNADVKANKRGRWSVCLDANKGVGDMPLNEHENEWSRKGAEEHVADLLDAAKNGAVQTIVDFDGNFEVRFIAPVVRPVESELSPPAEQKAELEQPDQPQIPAIPAVLPNS